MCVILYSPFCVLLFCFSGHFCLIEQSTYFSYLHIMKITALYIAFATYNAVIFKLAKILILQTPSTFAGRLRASRGFLPPSVGPSLCFSKVANAYRRSRRSQGILPTSLGPSLRFSKVANAYRRSRRSQGILPTSLGPSLRHLLELAGVEPASKGPFITVSSITVNALTFP